MDQPTTPVASAVPSEAVIRTLDEAYDVPAPAANAFGRRGMRVHMVLQLGESSIVVVIFYSTRWLEGGGKGGVGVAEKEEEEQALAEVGKGGAGGEKAGSIPRTISF